MCLLAESSFQSFSSRFGSISGSRSKVFLRPACGGVESSAEPIMEIPRFSERLHIFCILSWKIVILRKYRENIVT
jgi:hypothetical protein